jgi:hypothetical protein
MRGSRAQQRLDRTPFVHRAIALGHLIEWQREISPVRSRLIMRPTGRRDINFTFGSASKSAVLRVIIVLLRPCQPDAQQEADEPFRPSPALRSRACSHRG